MTYEPGLTATATIEAALADIVRWEGEGGDWPANLLPDAVTSRLKVAAAGPAPTPPGVFAVGPDEAVIIRPGGDRYIPRMLGRHHDVAAIREARKQKLPFLLFGPPGTGKTAMVEAAFNGGLYTVPGSGDTETADFIGTWVQLPDGTFAWVDGPLTKAMEEGRPLFIDEVALIDPKVMSVVYSAMDGRGEVVITANPARGTVKAQEGFYVSGAFNPNAPGARVSEALLSRFLVQVEVTTDYTLCRTLGVNAKFVTAARNLDVKRKNGELGWAPQLRECLAFKKVEEVFGLDMAIANSLTMAPEEDRAVVADVLARAFGNAAQVLTLGAQAV